MSPSRTRRAEKDGIKYELDLPLFGKLNVEVRTCAARATFSTRRLTFMERGGEAWSGHRQSPLLATEYSEHAWLFSYSLDDLVMSGLR